MLSLERSLFTDDPSSSEDVVAASAGPDPGVRIGLAGAASSMALLIWWVLRGPFVGLADNGDWGRYSCPLGLSSGVQFNRVPATLTAESCLAYDYRSSFTPFLWAFSKVDIALTGSVHLSHLALFWSLVVSAGWGWFAFELFRATRRPWLTSATVAAMILVSSDVIFTSYFGSIYAEALVIALMPALAAALIRVVRCERLDGATLAGTGLLVGAVTCAKPSMAFTAGIFLVVAVLARRRTVQAVRLVAAGVAVVGLTVYSIGAIPDPEFTEWNTYNLAFTVVLPESPDAQRELVEMGIEPANARALQRFVGVPFGPTATEAWDDAPLTAFRRAGRPAVLRALAQEPRTWVSMTERAGTTLGELRLDYLGNHTGPDDLDSPRLAQRPHPADAVLGVVAAGWWLLPCSWLALAAWCARRLWTTDQPGAAALPAIGLLGVAFAATQVMAALGDGYYELAKHLVIAGQCTALTFVGVAITAIATLAGRYHNGRTPPAGSAMVGPEGAAALR